MVASGSLRAIGLLSLEAVLGHKVGSPQSGSLRINLSFHETIAEIDK